MPGFSSIAEAISEIIYLIDYIENLGNGKTQNTEFYN
jgi:hypothetical protein